MTTRLRPHLAVQEIEAVRHPSWCDNRNGEYDPDGCGCADEDFAVVHGRGPHFLFATALDGKPTEITIDLCRVLLNGELVTTTTAEIVVSSKHLDLNRDELRMLIAELQRIDSVWGL